MTQEEFMRLAKAKEELESFLGAILNLVNHIIKAYRVKNQTALANALGVSKSAISRMIK